MKVAAPIYEKPSQLSRGLVVVLSIAVVLMSGWLAATILLPRVATTAAEGDADATASTLAAAPASSAQEMTASGTDVPQRTARSNAAQFDWPEEFNKAPPPSPAALPLAPAALPVAREVAHSQWPAAVVPDTAGRGLPARQPPPQAGTAAATDAIVDLLTPPSGAREATAAAVPLPRPVPPRRQKPRIEAETAQATSSADPSLVFETLSSRPR